ncbi:hypothetical protein ACWDYH_39240 [Nocardia goodfellowii]
MTTTEPELLDKVRHIAVQYVRACACATRLTHSPRHIAYREAHARETAMSEICIPPHPRSRQCIWERAADNISLHSNAANHSLSDLMPSCLGIC